MWIGEHPYFFIYLLGCVFSAILSFMSTVLFWIIARLTRSDVIAKNLRKIWIPPDTSSTPQKLGAFVGLMVLAAMFSWASLIIALGVIAWRLLAILRDAFASVPQAIQELRFPLKNNPEMSREAVWAYVRAISIKNGEKEPAADGLLSELDGLLEHYPSFSRTAALQQLQSLNVIDADTMTAAIHGQRERDRDYRCRDATA